MVLNLNDIYIGRQGWVSLGFPCLALTSPGVVWTWLFPGLVLTWLSLGPDWPLLDWLADSWSQLAIVLVSDHNWPVLSWLRLVPVSGSGRPGSGHGYG